MTTRHLRSVGLTVALLVAAPVSADPITWSFQGSFRSSIPEINGQPVFLDWTFDPATVSQCAGNPGNEAGVYNNQRLDVRIMSTVGPRTYHNYEIGFFGGYLVVNADVNFGCFAPGGHEYRLISPTWTRADEVPDVPGFNDPPEFPSGATINHTVPISNIPELWSVLFWGGAADGSFPAEPPASFPFRMQSFVGGGSPTGTFTLVPEPSSLLLLGSGLAVAWFARRRRARPSSHDGSNRSLRSTSSKENRIDDASTV